jgi:hypothetical protein
MGKLVKIFQCSLLLCGREFMAAEAALFASFFIEPPMNRYRANTKRYAGKGTNFRCTPIIGAVKQ